MLEVWPVGNFSSHWGSALDVPHFCLTPYGHELNGSRPCALYTGPQQQGQQTMKTVSQMNLFSPVTVMTS